MRLLRNGWINFVLCVHTVWFVSFCRKFSPLPLEYCLENSTVAWLVTKFWYSVKPLCNEFLFPFKALFHVQCALFVRNHNKLSNFQVDYNNINNKMSFSYIIKILELYTRSRSTAIEKTLMPRNCFRRSF